MENSLDSNLIQSLWIGNKLSNVERLCIQSFLDHGHPFHLYTYEDISNVPRGTTLHDAEKVISHNKIVRVPDGWGKGSVAGFADLFRLLLLQEKGGWWVDMDTVCLKRFDNKADTLICSSFEGQYGSLANNCVIKVQKNSEFINHCLDRINLKGIENLGYGAAGPFLFQEAVRELNIDKYVVPYYYHNPISWRFMHELILGQTSSIKKLKEKIRPWFKPKTMNGRKVRPETYSIHLWNEMWQRSNFNKDGIYSPECLFEVLKRKHHIA